MNGVPKHGYYADRTLKPTLARRYFGLLGDVRRVLDVGCGTGELGLHAPHGVEVVGIDADPGAVALAAAHETALVVDIDREALPFPAGSFDGVVAKDVLEHLQDPVRAVREIHRVLASGGVVVASLVMARPRRVWADYTHVRGFTAEAARLLFVDQGFEVCRIDPMGGVPLSNRLGFMDAVPQLLRLPVLSQLYASSWELKAVRP